MTPDRVMVAGVPVDPLSTSELLKRVANAVATRTVTTVVTVNAEYIVRATREQRFGELLHRSVVNTVDGYGVLWAVRRRGVQMPSRVGGSDLIWSIPEQAARLGHRVFLLGARPGVADQAAKRLGERYPGLVIAGTHAGSPATEDEDDIVHLIRRSRADILFVAYGSPQQDYWIDRNMSRAGVAVGMGVGGSFDYVAGTATRAPIWMRERGFEWLWRLMREPRRWRRMLALPVFAWLAWRSESSEARERKDR